MRGIWRVVLLGHSKTYQITSKETAVEILRKMKKVLPLAVAAETMPLKLDVTGRPRPEPSTGLVAGVQRIFSEICATWFEAESGFRT